MDIVKHLQPIQDQFPTKKTMELSSFQPMPASCLKGVPYGSGDSEGCQAVARQWRVANYCTIGEGCQATTTVRGCQVATLFMEGIGQQHRWWRVVGGDNNKGCWRWQLGGDVVGAGCHAFRQTVQCAM
ncbi:peptide chain release factor 2 [Sesbania bispinosa]|nr:peptide chain release factor 2 [Sesbania bispinosa]